MTTKARKNSGLMKKCFWNVRDLYGKEEELKKSNDI
jgi:hypothetical protein